jgi:hypothetical protein
MKAKRYDMPKGCRIPSVEIRVIQGAHELEAARMVDAMGAGAELTGRGMVTAERREAIRLSVTRLGPRPIDHAVPLLEIDGWSRKERAALAKFFDDLNGVSLQAMKAACFEAEPLTDGKVRHGKRYKLPPGFELETVDLWELGGHEELAAALKADANPKAGLGERALVHRRELIRLALREAGAAFDFDGLGLPTLTAVSFFFEDTNGIPEDELMGCVAAGVEVNGAPTAKTDQPLVVPGAAATG